jgi:glycosyltransferase involved in cell wall biosynthesis
VIYPPVATEAFTPVADKDDYYVTVSRLVPYKRVDLIAEAFACMPNRRLLIVGDGPERGKVAAKAGANVVLLGELPFAQMREVLQRARAFVFAAEEDFGIAPVEAQACGLPVIAFGRGGVCETIRGLDDPQPTGVFFGEQSVVALVRAVEQYEAAAKRISPEACRQNALRFSRRRFQDSFLNLVQTVMQQRAHEKTFVNDNPPYC